MKIFTRITAYIPRIITEVFLTLAFVLGVGVVSVVFRLVGRRMLKYSTKKSLWEEPTGSSSLARMY
ncbi:hypothetical protein HZB58_01595 [Candidatus Gottesmanbacteria bacterium]|nr:hypothetical protein [Candidatus Gottesmanbacteria bacterium]